MKGAGTMSQIDLLQTILLTLLVILAGLTEIRFWLDAKIKKLEKIIHDEEKAGDKP